MHAVVQSDGTVVEPRDWLQITFADGQKYVGRFSGVYDNPSHGLMYYLSYARPIDGSKPIDTVFCFLVDGNGSEEALDSAVLIEKPTKRKGKIQIIPRRPEDAVLH